MLKEFKNGNLHLKLEKETITDVKTFGSLILYLYNEFDFFPIGEEYNISNYDIGINLCYNGCYSYYSINGYHLRKLQAGKTIILYPLEESYINEVLENEI